MGEGGRESWDCVVQLSSYLPVRECWGHTAQQPGSPVAREGWCHMAAHLSSGQGRLEQCCMGEDCCCAMQQSRLSAGLHGTWLEGKAVQGAWSPIEGVGLQLPSTAGQSPAAHGWDCSGQGSVSEGPSSLELLRPGLHGGRKLMLDTQLQPRKFPSPLQLSMRCPQRLI